MTDTIFRYSLIGQESSAGRRANRLYEELRFALSRTDLPTIAAWGSRSAGRLVFLVGRRVDGVACLLSHLGSSCARELADLYRAARTGRAIPHLGDRTSAAIDEAIALCRDGKQLIRAVGRSLRDKPSESAPRILGTLLGFSTGSCGLDGDGGVPDLDLLFGIGAHRSVLTHTLVVGIVLEGFALALIDLATVVFDRLPVYRDPLWDTLAKHGAPLADGLTTGALAGAAYHLFIDAWIQPGALHGLPVNGVPLEAHQTITGASSLTEAIRTVQRLDMRWSVEIDSEDPVEKSTGRHVVDTVGQAVSTAWRAIGRGRSGG